MNTNGKLLTLDEALALPLDEANALYKKHVNGGLFDIYRLLGFTDMDVASAEGMYIRLKDGRNLLDFTSALGIVALGHNNPRILAVEERCQKEKILNAIKLGPHKLQAALAHNLAQLLPDPLSVAFFTVSGAEAVEAAMKLCERAQGKERRKFVTTANAYHGKTHLTLSFSRTSNFRDGFIQGIPEENMIVTPYGDIEALKELIVKEGKDIVAVIVEPLQGQGLELPPKGYLPAVVEACHKAGILVIFDEVKAGMSRTGTFCAFQDEMVVPDVVTMSKALGGGSRPMGAMVTSEELFKRAYGKKKYSSLHSTTFGGLGHSCAVAIETLNIVGDPEFQKSVKAKGEYLKDKLEALQAKYPNHITKIKGRGLMQGIEFNFRNLLAEGKLQLPDMPMIDTYDKAMMASLVHHLYKTHGILTHFSESNIATLHVMPPLIVEEKHLDTFVDAIDTTLSKGFVPVATQFVLDALKSSKD